MSIFDGQKGEKEEPNFGGKQNTSGDPMTLAEATRQAQGGAPHRSKDEIEAEENADLPSVNRRKGGSKVVTILGFIFIFFAALALIVSVNSGKDKTKKADKKSEQIENNLPPLVVPATPPPIAVYTPAATPQAGGQVIPVIQPGTTHTRQPHQGKPVEDWTDRKMGGELLASTTSRNGSGLAQATLAGRERIDADETETSGGASNDLASRLGATVTKKATASMLPNRNFLITKGTSLDCALETALDSTVPGLTTCRLTRDVYSDNGQVLLLDRGSQLVGEYQGGLKLGQARIFVLWTRAKTPNGVIVSLNSPGTDALGRSGLEGWVDNHFLQRFGAAILMSFINSSVPALINQNSGSGTTNIYGSTASGGEKVVEKILESTVNIPPTIIKNQGDHIQVMVARDLDFSTVYGLQVKK